MVVLPYKQMLSLGVGTESIWRVACHAKKQTNKRRVEAAKSKATNVTFPAPFSQHCKQVLLSLMLPLSRMPGINCGKMATTTLGRTRIHYTVVGSSISPRYTPVGRKIEPSLEIRRLTSTRLSTGGCAVFPLTFPSQSSDIAMHFVYRSTVLRRASCTWYPSGSANLLSFPENMDGSGISLAPLALRHSEAPSRSSTMNPRNPNPWHCGRTASGVRNGDHVWLVYTQ